MHTSASAEDREYKMTTEVLEYRLAAIERSVTDLRDVLIESKMQRQEIDSLTVKVAKHDEAIEALKIGPVKDKAARWQTIVDTLFKALVSISVTALLVKVGLQ